MTTPSGDASEAAAQALEQLKAQMAQPPFHGVLQPQPVSVDLEKGVVVISMKAKPEFRRSPVLEDWHGGVIATLIDLAAHAAVAVKIGRVAPTIDLRIDYLRGATGDLTATGRLLRAGRSIARADVEIADSQGRLVAVGRGTFSTLQGG